MESSADFQRAGAKPAKCTCSQCRRDAGNKKKEQRIENIIFSQEKYSNGETSLQFFDQYVYTNALNFLDDPVASLSGR